MSGNSLASLLAWMKVESRMMKWGLVVALERRKTNLIVLQEYIKRFSDSSYLPPITGEIALSENKAMGFIHDFVMDVPVLSFENANLNDSRAMLTMSVVGGNHLTFERKSDGWKTFRVDEIDPLQGPKLHLDLYFNKVPGDVDEDGRVKLDLRESDNFRLTFAKTPTDQRLGGDFFKELFCKLPNEKRIYTLGKIERGTNDLMHPQSFELRTQASGDAARDPKSSEYGDGAVLAFVRMEGRMGGDFPGESYKYLIPDDQGKDYSATVLFDYGRIMAAPILAATSSLLQTDRFNPVFNQNGDLEKADYASGGLAVAAYESFHTLTLPDGTHLLNMLVSTLPVVFIADDSRRLSVSVLGNKISVAWKSSALVEFTFSIEGKEPGSFMAQLGFELLVEYEVVQVGDGKELQQTKVDFVPDVSFVPPTDDVGSDEFWLRIVAILLSMLAPSYAIKQILVTVKEMLVERLTPETSMTTAIQEIIKLNFGQAIQGNEVYAPHDVAFFGRINPQQTSFLINPMQPIIKAGGSQQFTTTPVVSGVQWKVENLVEGPGNPGTINSSSGVYQAPAASAIKGRFTRVRVTATAPGSGYYSSALVTVVVNELTVHPLIEKCDLDTTVELSAGALGEGQLKWDVKNPVPGESGEVRPSVEPKGDHTYHHGPKVKGKTYVIDEIEVKNLSTGATRSVHVLALQKDPLLVVKIDRIDAQKGEVQLTAFFDEEPKETVDWYLPLGGPGSIDANGLYRASATATERYVLIIAELSFAPTLKFEGHLILPLPLVEFPQWPEVLSK